MFVSYFESFNFIYRTLNFDDMVPVYDDVADYMTPFMVVMSAKKLLT